MKKAMLISVLCFLIESMAFAQDYVNFTKSEPEPPVINVVQSTGQQVEYTIEICGMFNNNLTEEGEDFQRIEIPGGGKLCH